MIPDSLSLVTGTIISEDGLKLLHVIYNETLDFICSGFRLTELLEDIFYVSVFITASLRLFLVPVFDFLSICYS